MQTLSFSHIKHLAFAVLMALTLVVSPQLRAETLKEDPVVSQQAAVINVNTATHSQLQALKGIGPAKAQRILDYKARHGDFKSVEALTQVKGISLRILEQNKGRVGI